MICRSHPRHIYGSNKKSRCVVNTYYVLWLTYTIAHNVGQTICFRTNQPAGNPSLFTLSDGIDFCMSTFTTKCKLTLAPNISDFSIVSCGARFTAVQNDAGHSSEFPALIMLNVRSVCLKTIMHRLMRNNFISFDRQKAIWPWRQVLLAYN